MIKNILYGLTVLAMASMTLFTSCDKIDSDNYLVPVENVDMKGRKVLIEDFTGMACVNCPSAAELAKNLHELYPDKVIILANHVSFKNSIMLGSVDSLTSSVGDSYYDKFMKSSGFGLSIPVGLINRTNSTQGQLFSPDKWAETVIQQMSTEPLFSLSLASSFIAASNSVNVKVDITPLQDVNGKYLLTLLLIENDAMSPFQADKTGTHRPYVQQHVLREAITPYNGTAVIEGAAKKSKVISKTFSYNFQTKWERGATINFDKCAVIGFIQLEGENEILQVEEVAVK